MHKPYLNTAWLTHPLTGKKRELLESLDIPKSTKEVSIKQQADGNEEDLEYENDFKDDFEEQQTVNKNYS